MLVHRGCPTSATIKAGEDCRHGQGERPSAGTFGSAEARRPGAHCGHDDTTCCGRRLTGSAPGGGDCMQQQPLHFVGHDNGPGNDQYYVTRIDDMDSGVADEVEGLLLHAIATTGSAPSKAATTTRRIVMTTVCSRTPCRGRAEGPGAGSFALTMTTVFTRLNSC